MTEFNKSKNSATNLSKLRGTSYILVISIKDTLSFRNKVLGRYNLPGGTYLYAGSARASIKGRIMRHLRIAREKKAKPHWHIDYILLHRNASITDVLTFSGISECELSQTIASSKYSKVPVPGFGSSDCRKGCPAHFFMVSNLKRTISPLRKFLA